MSNPWMASNMPALHGQVAVVTGANSGLGLETTVGLAAAGAQVVMACRNLTKAQPALEQVLRRVPNARVQLMTLDLSDLVSVRAFASACAAAFPTIDLLCNNAGVMALPYQTTRDGFEMQIGTNHFGHFALTGLLLDQLTAAPAARVVTVASKLTPMALLTRSSRPSKNAAHASSQGNPRRLSAVSSARSGSRQDGRLLHSSPRPSPAR